MQITNLKYDFFNLKIQFANTRASYFDLQIIVCD